MKKVGLVSFAHESNSFNPNPTTSPMFKQGGLLFGNDIIHEWSGSKHEIAGMIEQSGAGDTQIVPLVSAWAMPAGPLEAGNIRRDSGRNTGSAGQRIT